MLASGENERENLEGRNRTCDGQRRGLQVSGRREKQIHREGGLIERHKMGLGGGEGMKSYPIRNRHKERREKKRKERLEWETRGKTGGQN